MELWRRCVLLLCTIVGTFLAMYVSLSPKVWLRAVDFAKSQEDESSRDEQSAYLRQLPLADYITAKTDGHQTIVESPLTQFCEEVISASKGEAISDGLRQRVDIEDEWSSPPFRVFFLPDEAWLSELPEVLEGTWEQPHYLTWTGPDGRRDVEAVLQKYDASDMGFGPGLANPPPISLLYPYRRVGLWLLVFGVVAYILLPRGRRTAQTIGYARWALVPADFVGMLLFVPFFALPMFLGGGATQAITHVWPITLVMWPLASLGAWLLIHMAEYASYEVHIHDDHIELDTVHGRSIYRFDRMRSFQPLSLQTPDWLVRLSWLGAMFGSGSSRFRMAGQAMVLGATDLPGLCIQMDDGSAAFLWVPKQAFGMDVKNCRRLWETVEATGIPWIEQHKVVKALVRPDGEGPDGTTLKRPQRYVLAGLILAPIVAMGIMLAGWFAVELFGSFDTDFGTESASIENVGGATESRFSAKDVSWERRFRTGAPIVLLESRKNSVAPPKDTIGDEEGQDTMACGFQQLADDGLLIYGCAGATSYLDGYVLKTNSSGEKQWEHQYGVDGKQLDYIVGACECQDGNILLYGTSGSHTAYLGGSRVFLASISAAGEKHWDLLWGKGTEFPEPSTAVQLPDGSFRVYGHVGTEPTTAIFRLTVSSAGVLIEETRLDVSADIADFDIRGITDTIDGGFALTGEISEPELYKNLLVAKYDLAGRLQWKRSFGGPKLETGRKIVQTNDGGLLAAGVVDTFQGHIRPYLIRLDANGNLEWTTAVGDTGQYELQHVRAISTGAFLLTCNYRSTPNSISRLLVASIEADGKTGWIKPLEQMGATYTGVSSIQLASGATMVVSTRTWGNQLSDAISLLELAEPISNNQKQVED